MGDHVDTFFYKQYINRKPLIAFVLAATTIVSLGLLIYSYTLKSSLLHSNSATIKCLEEQVRLKEELQKTMRMVEMERFRSAHLEEDLLNQKVIAEEAIKRMK
jgi:type II secretory pathway component PulJ